MKKTMLWIMVAAVAAVPAGCRPAGLLRAGDTAESNTTDARVITVNAEGIAVDLAGFGFRWNDTQLSVAVALEDERPAGEQDASALAAELLAEEKPGKPQIPPIKSAMIESSWQ